jgi:hypothetical protein
MKEEQRKCHALDAAIRALRRDFVNYLFFETPQERKQA